MGFVFRWSERKLPFDMFETVRCFLVYFCHCLPVSSQTEANPGPVNSEIQQEKKDRQARSPAPRHHGNEFARLRHARKGLSARITTSFGIKHKMAPSFLLTLRRQASKKPHNAQRTFPRLPRPTLLSLLLSSSFYSSFLLSYVSSSSSLYLRISHKPCFGLEKK